MKKVINNEIYRVVNECWDLLVIWQLKYIVNDLSFVTMPIAKESNYKSIKEVQREVEERGTGEELKGDRNWHQRDFKTISKKLEFN